jgi:thioredoxin 1
VLEQLKSEYAGKVKFAGLDAHENYETASNFGVMSIPTLIFFKDGKEISRSVGFSKKEKLAEEIQRHFGV